MAKIVLRDVSKSYGDVLALDSISLDVWDKEFVVFLGPSGCGKTTALRCIAGLETPDKGEIYVGDTLVNELPPKDRDVALVFQSYALYPHMTVFKNIGFPLKIRGKSAQSIENKVREVARMLRIEHLLDRKPKQLSGGEQQRVALGRALVREPQVFLMDEPLSNLDAKLRLHMRAEVKRLQKELGITTIYVTHDQAEAMTMADRIVVLNNGILQQVDVPEQIYNNPNNSFVGGFIGSPPMNFLSGQLVKRDNGYSLDVTGFRIYLPDRIQEVLRKGNYFEVIMGIRPEELTISKGTIDQNSIALEVYVLEPLGSEVVVDFKVGDTFLKVKTKGTFKASLGESMYVTPDVTRLHLFEDDTNGKVIL